MNRRHAAAGDTAHLPHRRRLGTRSKSAIVDPLPDQIYDPIGSLHATLPRPASFF